VTDAPKTDAPKVKDHWDKLGIVLQPVGGLLTALSVAYVGVIGSRVIEDRQSQETNARLYSELMSRREEAESSLRKDMLVSIIEKYLAPTENDLDAKVLQLEMLADNFHDSLDLRPLFFDLQRKLLKSKVDDRDDLLYRIESLARDITAKQLFALEGRGARFSRTVDFDALRAAGKPGIALDGELITIGDKSCDVNVRVLGEDTATKQVRVRLEARACEEAGRGDPRATFEVSYFDFPMIDNTRLANGWRCAVVLTNFADVAAELTTICFPGEYASLKDRPYYDEVIQKLKGLQIGG
jgi:hypothetical protein